MSSVIRRIGLTFFKILILTACQEGKHQLITTDLPTYQKLGKMSLNVAMVRHQQLPQDPLNLKEPLSWPPSQALKDWATQRIKPDASEGVAVIILRNYNFQDTPIIPEGNFFSRWTTFDKERLDASMNVAIEIYDGKNNRIGEVGTTVSHSSSFEYELTPADRQGAWRKEMMELLEQLDFQMRTLLDPYLLDDTP